MLIMLPTTELEMIISSTDNKDKAEHEKAYIGYNTHENVRTRVANVLQVGEDTGERLCLRLDSSWLSRLLRLR